VVEVERSAGDERDVEEGGNAKDATGTQGVKHCAAAAEAAAAVIVAAANGYGMVVRLTWLRSVERGINPFTSSLWEFPLWEFPLREFSFILPFAFFLGPSPAPLSPGLTPPPSPR